MWSQTPPKPRPSALPYYLPGESPAHTKETKWNLQNSSSLKLDKVVDCHRLDQDSNTVTTPVFFPVGFNLRDMKEQTLLIFKQVEHKCFDVVIN